MRSMRPSITCSISSTAGGTMDVVNTHKLVMLKRASTPKTESSSPGGHEVFRARVSGGALALIEVNAGDARSVYRNWLASLDEKAARLIAGKPSDDVARRVVEVAENYLQAND